MLLSTLLYFTSCRKASIDMIKTKFNIYTSNLKGPKLIQIFDIDMNVSNIDSISIDVCGMEVQCFVLVQREVGG